MTELETILEQPALLQRMPDNEKEQLVLELERVLRKQAEDRFYYFFRQAWPIIWKAIPFEKCSFYEPLCDELQEVAERNFRNEDCLNNVVVNVPPGTAKTTLFSVAFHPWVWIEQATKRFITTSYSPKKAYDNCLASINLIKSPWYQRNWCGKYQLNRDLGTDCQNSKGGYRIITAPDVKVGTGYHADFIIGDDNQNAEEVYSSAYREKVCRWRDETMSTRLANKRTGVMIDVQQRLHIKDLTAHIKNTQASLTKFISLPAENTYKNVEPPEWEKYYIDGLLSPNALLSPLVLSKAKTQLRNAYQGQYNQHPVPSNGTLFKDEWVRWVTAEQLPEMELVVVSADTAQTDKQSSCPVSIQTWAKERGAPNFYLLGDETDIMSILSTEKRIVAVAAVNPGCVIVIEREASGYTILENLKKVYPLVFGFDPRKYGGKEKRAEMVSRYWEAGNVFILLNEYYKSRYVPEIIDFPNGPYKDRVDAMSQALIWINREELTRVNPNPNPQVY
jgi:phage terminase large subunit-like protein